jgi:hypothetical protein
MKKTLFFITLTVLSQNSKQNQVHQKQKLLKYISFQSGILYEITTHITTIKGQKFL